MICVALRTDNPQAELYLYVDGKEVGKEIWQAHRELSSTLHSKLRGLLEAKGNQLHDINGVVVYQGPGSFTGLRIGISVANALGASLNVPVVAAQGDNWRTDGLSQIAVDQKFIPVEPYYGSDPHITQQKK